MTEANSGPGTRISGRTGVVAGAVLLVASVLTVLAMAHHPTGLDHGGGIGGMGLGGLIHATMIVLLAANLWGLTVFSLRLGPGGWVLLGIIAYLVSFLAHLLAAMTNGFIVPAVARSVDHAASGDLFVLLWQSNQAFAGLGTYAASVAFLAWAVVLAERKTPTTLLLAAAGVAVALLPAGALFAGLIKMDVHGALIVYGAHAAWIGLVGIQMLRRAV